MTIHFGNVPAVSVLYIPFTSYNSAGASVTLTGLATSDIKIYKNGSTTERNSTSGYTLLDTDGIDFDGVTGLHGFSIDLDDNSDTGFYEVGAQYWVVVSTVTIDGQTVTLLACTFRIGPAESVAGVPVVDAAYVNGSSAAAAALSALFGSGCVTGTVDSATTTSITDAELTQADTDQWVGARIVMTSGAAQYESREISSFSPGSDTIDFFPDLTTAPSVGDTYIIIPNAPYGGPTSLEVANDVWATVVDGSTSAAESMRLQNSALGGKLSGAGTGTETVRDLADSKDRLVYTVDSEGNRTAVTRDLT